MKRKESIRRRTRIPIEVLRETTNAEQERNIYLHRNALARDIFWQRLEWLYRYLLDFTRPTDSVLDLGGGSGVFLKALCSYYDKVDVLDLDTSDASAIAERLDFLNAHIVCADMTTFTPNHKYDVVIMADVLEHFDDLEVPFRCIKRLLNDQGGKLIVSLPTENWLYELGRLIVRKEKPVDHYHSSSPVIHFLQERGLRLVTRRYSPRYCMISVPLFDIAVFILPAISPEGDVRNERS